MEYENSSVVIFPAARATVRFSDRTWYEATYLAAAAYLADLEDGPGSPVEVMLDRCELSAIEQDFMVAVGRVHAGDRRIAVKADGEVLDVVVQRSAMRALRSADEDAGSDAIVNAHGPFPREARARQGAGGDVEPGEAIAIGAEAIED